MTLSCRMLCIYVVGLSLCVSRVVLPKAWHAQRNEKVAATTVQEPVSSYVGSEVLDQKDWLYEQPLLNNTLRSPEAVRNFTDGGAITKIADFFYELEWVCQRAGSSEIFMAGTGRPETMYFRSERDENLPRHIGFHSVGDEVVISDRILWTGLTFGTMTHVGHWIVYVAAPFMVFLKEYLGLANEHRLILNAPVKEKEGWVYQITSIFTGYALPVTEHVPNVTTCYERGYFGFPTTPDPTMSLYFDDYGHVFYQMIRERFRKWAGIPFSPRFYTVSKELPLVTLTIRTSSSGFGRNLTNAGEVKEYMDKTMGGLVRTQVISWNHYTVKQQMKIGRDTDVMVGVHGNNLIWMTVMDPMKVTIELMPFGFEGTTKGVNPAFGVYKHAFYSYVGLRANQTFLTWTASTAAHSPLAPREEYQGKVFSHRCMKRKKRPKWSARLWMCRHLTPPPHLIANLVNFSLPYVGRFDGVGYHGLFPFEEQQLARGDPLL